MRYEWRHGPITKRRHDLFKDSPDSHWFWEVLEVWL